MTVFADNSSNRIRVAVPVSRRQAIPPQTHKQPEIGAVAAPCAKNKHKKCYSLKCSCSCHPHLT